MIIQQNHPSHNVSLPTFPNIHHPILTPQAQQSPQEQPAPPYTSKSNSNPAPPTPLPSRTSLSPPATHTNPYKTPSLYLAPRTSMGSDSRCYHHVYRFTHAYCILGNIAEWLGHLLRLVPFLLRYRSRWRVPHDCHFRHGKRRRFRQGVYER